MGQDRYKKPLGPVDSAFWYLDTDATPMNIGSLLIFDGPLDFLSFRRLIDARLPSSPIYKQRVVDAPFNLGEPIWVYDDRFYIENHVFRRTVDRPGTLEQLRVLCSNIISSRLPRNKPLWEVYLIDGLEYDRSAVLFKVHHAMVDGISAVELLSLLLDFTDDPPTIPDEQPVYDPPPPPKPFDLLSHATRNFAPHRWDLLKKVGDDMLNMGSHLLDRDQRRKTLIGTLGLAHDMLSPISRLAINGENTGRQQIAWAEFSLAAVRAIRKSQRVSINDVMLTILGAGFGRYLEEVGDDSPQPFVRAIVPVNMRQMGIEENVGNRISMLPIELPRDAESPLERLEAVSRYATALKDADIATTFDLAFTLPALAPALMQPLIWLVVPRLFAAVAHTWATNVPGPQIPLYLLGRKMLHVYGYFPLNPSMGVASVILSYNGFISINVVADKAIVPDVTRIREHLYAAYDELCLACGITPIRPLQDEYAALAHKSSTGTTKATEEGDEAGPLADAEDLPADEIREEVSQQEDLTPLDIIDDKPDVINVRPVHIYSDTDASDYGLPIISAGVNGDSPNVPMVARRGGGRTGEAAEASPQTETSASAADTSQPAVPEETPGPAETVSAPPKKARIMSEEWAQALHDTINSSTAYYRASTRWTSGPVALVMDAAPSDGFAQAQAVLLDLHKGKCRSGHNVSVAEAYKQASFVLEADYATWMDILEGRAQALPMIVRGKVRLKKGALARLLPFTKSSQELVNCAIAVT